MTPPEPPGEIPDFLLEQFDDLSPETLRGVSDYALEETYVAPDGMPDAMSESFALQDDDTLEAIASYADSIAEFLDENEAESLVDLTGDQGGEEEAWGRKRILEWHE
ncbi:hypothetical protein [Natrinema sp. SYSU A 869]|uniref:hypothetical protein n=1 Tax=Natrinema sp. SYSU A 869 TaxID=2871694 RepID=UPI001CA45E19|nr:hypothetical protein [Natrinema sp. SYSU A 869]